VAVAHQQEFKDLAEDWRGKFAFYYTLTSLPACGGDQPHDDAAHVVLFRPFNSTSPAIHRWMSPSTPNPRPRELTMLKRYISLHGLPLVPEYGRSLPIGSDRKQIGLRVIVKIFGLPLWVRGSFIFSVDVKLQWKMT
jgi:hypothetical protein